MNRENWEVKKIGDCFLFIRNGANIKQADDAEGIPITRIETLSNDMFNRDRLGYANIFDVGKYEKYILDNKDILMSHINSVKYLGRAVLYQKKEDESIIHGMNLLCLRVINSILRPQFITYYFKSISFKIQVDRITKKAVNQASFPVSSLKECFVPVPSLPIQEKIVKELDTLHDILAKKKEQLKDLDKLAQATFYDMFGDPVENEKGWDIDILNNVCDVRDGTHDSPKYQSEGYPLITSKNLTSGEINFEKINLISKGDFENINKRSRVDVGDILMPMIGTIGNPVIVQTSREFAIKNVALIKFRTPSKVSNIFILNTLKSESFFIELMSKNKGGTQKFVSLGTIRDLKIPVPSLLHQNQFAAKIEVIEKQKELISRSIKEVEQLIGYTMDKYFN